MTVEINTIFEQLVAMLSKIEPAKLNETLGAFASAVSDRGDKFGQMLSDMDTMLAKLNPSLGNLSADIAVAPQVLNAYADAAPDLVTLADSASRLSDTIVEKHQDLDALLLSAIGFAEIGNDVIGGNRQQITEVMRLLVPTTDLTNEYNAALNCALAGMVPLATAPRHRFPVCCCWTRSCWAPNATGTQETCRRLPRPAVPSAADFRTSDTRPGRRTSSPTSTPTGRSTETKAFCSIPAH